MMLYPSINEDLKDKADSRYTLVMLAAKRARDIIAGKPVLTEVDAVRPVSLATNEIAEKLITYKRVENMDFYKKKSNDKPCAQSDNELEDVIAEDEEKAEESEE